MVDENDEGLKEESKKKNKESSSGKNYLLLVVVCLNVIIMGGVGYLQYTAHMRKEKESSVRDIIRAEMDSVSKEQSEGTQTLPKEKDGFLYPLKGFTANLAQGDGPRRFLNMTAVLKFSKDSKEEEFKAREPQIRDRVISIINSKRPEDLLKIEGKAFLKEEIKASINTFLIDGHVVDIFYVGFQIN